MSITDLQTEFVRTSATHKALTDAKTLVEGVLSTMTRTQSQNAAALAELTASLKASSSAYGEYSATDQLLRVERFAGKAASIDHVKANPNCNEQQATKAWQDAALAATGRKTLLQDPGELGALYREQLVASGLITEPTWEAQRAWIAATDKDAVMGL
jgi:hypothetical protein